MSKKELSTKNVKARVKLIRVLPYKGCMVYIRMIGSDLFMYDLIYNNELYSSNIIITPGKGKTKLSNEEVQSASSLIWAGAVATIDTLLGDYPSVTAQQEEATQKFIEMGEKHKLPKERIVN